MIALALLLLVSATPSTPGTKPFRLEPTVDVDERLKAKSKVPSPAQADLERAFKQVANDPQVFAKGHNRLVLGHYHQTLFPTDQLRFAEVIDDEHADVDRPLKHQHFTLFLQDRAGVLRTLDVKALRSCELEHPAACRDLMPYLRPRLSGPSGAGLAQELAELKFLGETSRDYPELPRLWLGSLDALGPPDLVRKEQAHPSPVEELKVLHVNGTWSILGYAQSTTDGYGCMQASSVRFQLTSTGLEFTSNRVAWMPCGP